MQANKSLKSSITILTSIYVPIESYFLNTGQIDSTSVNLPSIQRKTPLW